MVNDIVKIATERVEFVVEYEFHQYNTGRGDNQTFTAKRVFDGRFASAESEARDLANRIKSAAKGNPESMEWDGELTDKLIFNLGLNDGYFTGNVKLVKRMTYEQELAL